MKEHLTIDEIIRAVSKSADSLAASRYKHFKSCEKCRQAYQAQLSADRLLKSVRPKNSPALLKDRVLKTIALLSPVKARQKTDWAFMVSMILLFSIASWYIFSGKARSVIQEYTPEIVKEKPQSVEPGVLDVLKDGISAINIQFNWPDFNFGNIYLAVGILVILLYMLVDRKINRNFKIHKT